MDILGYTRNYPGKALYIVYSPTAVTAPLFTVRGQASQGGRMDVVAASIIAAQHDPNPRFSAVLMGPPSPVKVLYVSEWGFKGVNQVIYEILRGLKGDKGRIAVEDGEPLDPVYMCKGCKVLLMDEAGEDVSSILDYICGDVAILLGGHTGFPDSVYTDLKRVSDRIVSIGPVSLQTYQVILYLAWKRATTCMARPAAGKRSPGSP